MDIKTVENNIVKDKYYVLDHPSGLTIYVYPKEGYQSTYAIIGTKYGSVNTRFKVDDGEEITAVQISDGNGNAANPNKNLGLTRSHHISASFSQRLGENAIIKIEPYWQYLFDVPVEIGSTFSILNHNLFYQDRALVNEGVGRNYGIDLTLERYLKDGLYGMFTATLFKSEYRDAQGEWHNTRHDRTFVTNILGGKEWMVGKSKKNVFGFNGRFTLMGGDRYTPMPEGLTLEEVMKRPDHSIPDDGDKPFSKQMGLNTGFAFSVKYTINGKRKATHLILEYLKVRSFQGKTFNIKTHEVEDKFTSLTFPNIAYRLEF